LPAVVIQWNYQLHNTEMITKWSDDYLVVMAYVNQYCLGTFACLE
jgi:hypothetical protein